MYLRMNICRANKGQATEPLHVGMRGSCCINGMLLFLGTAHPFTLLKE
ncbi:hypothetical protein SAMN05216378_5336 [Paenibacillus catalpae]|uniref:Uncharacterized protein n=1 Tax=Paenibacillus catalpae TaxID=1045775 RepID=A0A1I2GP04_9BACL|nr:hypothetical protein [Paenibacillus catalpae]SFF18331.1 hypothetical protein SAMN05216378_5336 [Paenibacillus catalpae]